MNFKKHSLLLGILVAFPALASPDTSQDDSLELLMSMSLEELTLLDITMETASKSEQSISEIPASVYVLSNERIIRSGARNITEALALIPGMYVSKWNENSYHVSSRGFHDGLFNKMLVMIDGRSVYSPIYGGVYWSAIDMVLNDVDRIEVLRGPSGAIWGGNAANGVINIITKSAEETQGTFLSSTFGRFGTYDATIRQGNKLGDDTYGRAFYKRKSQPQELNSHAEHWVTDTAGVTIETVIDDKDVNVSFGGSKLSYDTPLLAVHYDEQDPINNPVALSLSEFESSTSSAYVQARMTQQLSETKTLQVKTWIDYVDETAKDAPGSYTTLDIDVNYHSQLSDAHSILYGAGYRYQYIDFTAEVSDIDWHNLNAYGRYYDQSSARDSIVNAYAQSEYYWTDTIKTTVGVKAEYFEQNRSFELSPQARVLWQAASNHTLWAGIGRAVVAPSYMNSNSYYTQSGFFVDQDNNLRSYTGVYLPDDSVDNESVITYETGYRYDSNEQFALDFNIFYSQHDNMRGHDYAPELANDGAHNHLDFYTLEDHYGANTYGVEMGAQLSLHSDLDLFFSYSYLTVNGTSSKENDNSIGHVEIVSIPHQHLASVQAMWDVSESIQFDVTAKYQDITLSDAIYDYYRNYPGVSVHDIDALLTIDTRLAWQHNTHYPLVEFIAQKIGQDEEYDSWGLYANEERVQVRVSHEF